MMKEEEARIRILTEIAQESDPRVLQHKEELRLKQEKIKAEREVRPKALLQFEEVQSAIYPQEQRLSKVREQERIALEKQRKEDEEREQEEQRYEASSTIQSRNHYASTGKNSRERTEKGKRSS